MKEIRFGTDGIRGIYGEDLTEETAYALGAALAKRGDILLGRDDRPSSPALARAIACGAHASGGGIRAVGLTTTPALYYLLTISDCSYAVMVTASHNPPAHNGLKVFTKSGKPTERDRRALESEMRSVRPSPCPVFTYRETQDISPYTEYLKERIRPLDGITVVLDCANGAGSAFKGLYRELGAHEISINAEGDGARINVNCGALHPEACAREVLKRHADLGVSIDGDGDRIVLVTRDGEILDGDHITYILACRMQEKGRLKKSTVAMTVMTNGGVLRSLSERGIRVISTAVGDAALAAAMREEGLNLGGEQSGHVILGDYLATGDGLLTGAVLMQSFLEEGEIEKTPPPVVYPQVLLNVEVGDKSLAEHPEIRQLAKELKEEMNAGRILLRASGTEDLLRIMVEHPDAGIAKSVAERLREAILRKTK